jgi:acyl-[acyl-carrier-protein]-phospholipid O-acyltransferase/long-chain-fatty-acid--[acyl-carrier-protein] ligase
MNKQWFYLFSGNFSGVFNDNLLKNAILFVAVNWSLPDWLSRPQLVALVSGALILPYLILSPLGGRWAVMYSKLAVFRWFKLLEFPIMALASFAFLVENIYLAIVAVLLMGIQSCLYSPAKYGLIRDIGGVEGSAKGSGIFEAMAFLGILAGTVTAAAISDSYRVEVLIALFFGAAVIGYLMVVLLRVDELPVLTGASGGVHVNPLRFIRSSYHLALGYNGINRAVAGVSFFWMIGGMLQMNIIVHAGSVLKVSNTTTGIIMSMAAIGVIAGNWLAGLLLNTWGKKRLLLVGLSGMAIGMGILSITSPGVWLFGCIVSMIALAGGFYQVPWLAHIQQSNAGRRAGQLLAYMNIMVFVFVLGGTLLFSVLNMIGNDSSFLVFFVLLLLIIAMFFSTVRYLYRKSNIV